MRLYLRSSPNEAMSEGEREREGGNEGEREREGEQGEREREGGKLAIVTNSYS